MPARTRNLPWWSLYTALAVLAFGTRLLVMVRGGGLFGSGGYDDGVYYAAADAVVHGRMPYADFLLIQPPGVLIVGAPFAWLGTLTTDGIGLAAARLAFMVVGAISTMLIAFILRRFGFAAAAAGGIFYAVGYVAAYSERSILLEPFGTLGVLIALAVLSRPRLRANTWWLLGAGFALGAATGFKIWYVVPAVIIIAFAGARGWWRMLLGAIVGASVVYLPFFIAAPTAAFREIVLMQLGRDNTRVTLLTRFHVILGDYPLPRALSQLGMTLPGLVDVMSAIGLAGAAVALTVRRARLYVLLLAVDVVVLLVAPSFFLHYAALTEPMVALVFGVAVGRLVEVVRWRTAQAAVIGVVAVALAVGNAPDVLKGAGWHPPVAELTAEAAHVHGCVMAADPTLLALTDVLSRDLATGCRFWPDVTGLTYGPYKDVMADGRSVPRADNKAWQDALVDYLSSGSAVFMSRTKSTGFDHASYHALTHDGPMLYRQTGLAFARTDVHAP